MHLGRFELQDEALAMAGVHAALLRTGQVLYFSYDPEQENTLERGFWQLWDPDSGTVSDEAAIHTRNFFCAGHCFLADGRLLVAGGQSYNWFPFVKWGADHDLHTYDPVEESWERHEDMPGARWYPTCTTLPDGRAIIAGGHAVRYRPIGAINDEYEIFYPARNEKSDPRHFNPGHVDTYPFMCVLPDRTAAGTLFVYSKDEARLFSLTSFTWRGNAKRFRTALRKSRTYDHQGSFVLLPLVPSVDSEGKVSYGAGRVLVIGGEGDGGRATNTAEIFAFNPDDPLESSWQGPTRGNMAFERFMGDAVLLPDGTVLLVNGASAGKADESYDPVMTAELFNPADESWKNLAQLKRPRMYHSSALLLPDARVVIAGNTEHWNPGNPHEETSIEIYTPPYLLDDQGRRRARPKLDAAPAEMQYAKEYDLTVPRAADIESVALLRAGSTTHTNNMDQRYVGLFVVRRDSNKITVKSPPDGTIAPPGYYMLFVIDENGVPSVAKFVRVAGLERRITCIRKSTEKRKQYYGILAVGGQDADGARWELPVDQVIAAIESGVQSFYVEEPEGDRVEVIVVRRTRVASRGRRWPGAVYIKTTTDRDAPNNLLALPGCP